MNFKTLFLPLSFAGLVGVSEPETLQKQLHEWLIFMHKEQVKLLKINWGNPGLCTEWDRNYDPKTRACGGKRKLTERKLP